jgi:hypothetical protein
MMRLLYILTIFLVVSVSIARAQHVNSDRILLKYNTLRENADGIPIKTFHVSETIGEWADLNTPGSVTCEETDGFGSATIRIYRTDATVIIKILMSNEAEDVFELPITEYQVIQ